MCYRRLHAFPVILVDAADQIGIRKVLMDGAPKSGLAGLRRLKRHGGKVERPRTEISSKKSCSQAILAVRQLHHPRSCIKLATTCRYPCLDDAGEGRWMEGAL